MKTIETSNAPAAIGPYSQAVQVGDMLYTSGSIPLDASGTFIGDEIQGQTRQVFKNLRAILSEAGTSLDNVVKATVFVQDLNDFAKLNEIYAEEFGNHKPARSTVQVARLPMDSLVEIELVVKL